ncbi:MAG TPA: hypothetical protein VNT60_09480, partial [Deinococcales bacterium]|nr:hypothetical protein [Deinococcales bacterium]
MPLGFRPVELPLARVRAHLASLPSPIDSFLEGHVLESRHYEIVADGAPAGLASVHKGTLLTQFMLDEPHRRHGQAAWRLVRGLESMNAAFVPTCDEFFLSHALDDYRRLAKQAYFFTAPAGSGGAAPAGFSLRPAVPDDLDLVRAMSGDFFPDAPRMLAAGELFVT